MAEAFQVRPDFKARDPLWHHLAGCILKRHAQDAGIARTGNRFNGLITGRTLGFRYQAGHHQYLRIDIQPLLQQTAEHGAFQCAHLVENIDHLATGVRTAEHIILPEPAMRRQDRDRKNHRDVLQEPLQPAG